MNILQTMALASGALITMLAAHPARAQTLDLARIAAVADSAANAQIAGGGTPGMTVAVARNGEVVFARGYGTADVEMGVPASAETVYKTGSITKEFTAAVVMRLVEAGRMSLDDPITKYLPDYPVQGHAVTIRHLLNHTSGIRGFRIMHEENRQRFRADLGYAELVALFGTQPFDFAPGEKYAYNNMAFYLLGEIIGRVTGTPYAEYTERELLRPLGMERTVACYDERVIPNRAEGYEFVDGQLVHGRFLSMRIASSAGVFCSTVGDLLRWAHLLHGGRVVSPASLRRMMTPTVLASGDTVGYGLGLQLSELGGHPRVYHTGGANGHVTILSHYPDDGISVAVMINSTRGNPVTIEKAVARAALGVRLLDLPLAAGEAARYEGTYTYQSDGQTREMRVFGEEGRLMARFGGGRPFALRHQGGHVFVPAPDDDARLVFTLRRGRAEGVTIHEGRWDVTRATRKP